MDDPSSSLPTDVFLSFRGQDTRENFVCHLHKALERKTLKVYIDKHGLKKGDDLSDLLKAIAESKISIVVFSENYASSTWCLIELVKIMECKAKQKQIVMPIFYRVDPSDIRKQRGSFGQAFAKHERERERKKDKKLLQEVQSWRSTLKEATDLAGWDSKNYQDDDELINDIVRKVFDKVKRISPCSHTDDGLVAMDFHLWKMRRLLDAVQGDVVHVGICGMGGIGKTTIAKAVYGEIAQHFDHSCFVKNVREGFMKKGEVQMQREFLSEILNDSVENFGGGDHMLMLEGLCNKKVLVVLDDVLDSIQMETLLGKKRSFGVGSIIIVTTRDEHVLCGFKNIYKPKRLTDHDALKLFSQNAFNGDEPSGDQYEHLSRCIVEYAHGLPLALKVLGSLLRNRTVSQWEGQFKKLRKYPNPQIKEVLKISYDGLDHSQQNIFLDIACFFKGMDKDYVTEVLGDCGYFPDIDLNVLVDRSLVTISDSNKLVMHDLLQEMGIQIESIPEYEKRRRFWSKDAARILTENMAAENVEGLMIDGSRVDVDESFYVEAFAGMRKLRMLHIFNHRPYNYNHNNCPRLIGDFLFLSRDLRVLIWYSYPSKCLPPNFDPKNLVHLDLRDSHIEYLWEGPKRAYNLRRINLSCCRYLKEIPDLTELPNLEKLDLTGCSSLTEVHPSISALKNLVFLSLSLCGKLKSLPRSIHMKSLETLNLTHCYKLEMFPEISGNMEALSELKLGHTAIKELPSSIGRLRGLKSLDLVCCSHLICLPDSICNLAELRSLDLRNCSKLNKLPENFGSLKSLVEVQLERSGLEQLPVSTLNLKVDGLSFECCRQMAAPLSSWPSSIQDRCAAVIRLDFVDCNLVELSDAIVCFSSLKVLRLSKNDFLESLPVSMNQLILLEQLDLDGCKRLKSIPELSSSISYINAEHCTALETVSAPQSPYDIGRCFTFTDCSKLVQKTLFREIVETHFPPQGNCSRPFYFSCPGSEMPEQFIHQGRGSSVTAKLPPNWFDNKFLGFAVCAVTKKRGGVGFYYLPARCFCTFKGDHCEYRFSFSLFNGRRVNSSYQMLVGYIPWSEFGMINGGEEVNERHYTEAKFEIELFGNCMGLLGSREPCIERCGVRFFFGNNEEGIREVDNSETSETSLEACSVEVECRGSDITNNTSDKDEADEQYQIIQEVFKGANRKSSNIKVEDNTSSGNRNSKPLDRWTQVVRVTSGLRRQGDLDDGFQWHRHFSTGIGLEYACFHAPGCRAEAEVPTPSDPTILQITYAGRHTCWKDQPMLTHQVRIAPGMGNDGPFDGFMWGEYDQKDVPGAKYPRFYYVCTPQNVGGCMAVKEVQRSNDQNILQITYRLRHTCTPPSSSIGGRADSSSTVASGASSDHDQIVESPNSPGANGLGENVIRVVDSSVDDASSQDVGFPDGGRMTEMETLISTGDADPHFYLCGRLLGMRKEVVLPVFTSAFSGAWNLKERLVVHEEEPGVFVFQFSTKAERDRIIGSGPWSFSGSMLILAEYDGLRSLGDVSLNSLEAWVSVTGLRFAMRNRQVLARIGNMLGVFLRPDPGFIQRKDKTQRIRVVFDVRNRIPASISFEFSSEISVSLILKLERCHGLCRECGLFDHGGGLCDRGLLAAESGLVVSEAVLGDGVVPGAEEVAVGLEREVLVGEKGVPAAMASVRVADGCGTAAGASELVAPAGVSASVQLLPTFSAGVSDSNSCLTGQASVVGPSGLLGAAGLKRKLGLGTMGFDGDGPPGPALDVGNQSSLNFDALVEIPVRLGKIPKT